MKKDGFYMESKAKGKLYDDEIGDMKAQSLSKIFTVKDKFVYQTATVYDDFIPVKIPVINILVIIDVSSYCQNKLIIFFNGKYQRTKPKSAT